MRLRVSLIALSFPWLFTLPVRAGNAIVHDTDPINLPLLGNSGQTHVTAFFGQKAEGVHLTAAVAVAPRVALIAAAAYANHNNCFSCRVSERRHGELGIGTYHRETGTGMVWETYFGGGMGRAKLSGGDEGSDQISELRVTGSEYQTLYAQANLGKRLKWDDRAGALRLAGYKFTGLTLQDGNGQSLPVNGTGWGFYLEPALVYRLGYRAVKLDLQLGASLPLIQPEGLDNEKIWATLGIGFDILGN